MEILLFCCAVALGLVVAAVEIFRGLKRLSRIAVWSVILMTVCAAVSVDQWPRMGAFELAASALGCIIVMTLMIGGAALRERFISSLSARTSPSSSRSRAAAQRAKLDPDC